MRLTGSSQTMVTHGVCASTSSTGRSATAVPPAGVRLSPSESGIGTILATSTVLRQRAADTGRVAAERATPMLTPRWLGWRRDRDGSGARSGSGLGPARGPDYRLVDRPLRVDDGTRGIA